jgi:hypothetical protein
VGGYQGDGAEREKCGDTLKHDEGYMLIDSGNFDSGTESAGQ